MTDTAHPGGLGLIGELTVARLGYGAMQLDDASSTDDAVALLRRAIEHGVNHIDTASFYAGGEVNRRIRRALAPYRDDLVIVSKVGATHTTTGVVPLIAAQQPAELRAAVEADLAALGFDHIPVVNLRRLDLGPGLRAEGDQIVDLDDQLAEMIALRDEGKIGAIGISNVPLEVLQRAQPAGIVCAQNAYSVLDRSHEGMLDFCVAEDIAWVPFFPLGSAFPGLRRSPTTRWCGKSPPTSVPHQRRSGSHGCWRTRQTHCSSPARGRSPTSRKTSVPATSPSARTRSRASTPPAACRARAYLIVMASRRSLLTADEVPGRTPDPFGEPPRSGLSVRR
jgi:pyridoxine 4-dehydrogenase